MTRNYVLPKLAMAMNEGTINEWLVSDGDYVEKGQLLVVVETEKVINELEAPETGFVRILTPAGETVPVDTPIAVFADNADELNTTRDSATQTPIVAEQSQAGSAPQEHAGPLKTPRIKSSPLARKLAAQHQVDLQSIQGSGPGGRIVKRDLVAALADNVMHQDTKPAASSKTSSPDGLPAELVRIPLTGSPRAAIARHMTESLNNSAQLSAFWESDMTELLKAREVLLSREKHLGTRVSINAFIIKAMASAIVEVPIANAALIDDEVIIYRSVNVGIAIALPGNTRWDSKLMVPVLKNVQMMGIVEIDLAMKALVARARDGVLTADDMKDSTITLSSTAGIAPPGTHSTPILNMPNAVIIGPSTPQDKVVSVEGTPMVRPMMPISMTFDHRVLDGEPAARFMNAMHERIENPTLMLA